MTETQYVIDGSGELIAYADEFKNVTQADAEAAEILENEILMTAGQISIGYLQLAKRLHTFMEKKYYLARNYSTMWEWADSPSLQGIGSRTARDLIRIYEEIVPILAKHDAMEVIPMVQSSKMRALLPILADDNAEKKVIEAVYRIKDLTIKDSYAAIKEIRGIKDHYDDEMPVVFKAKLLRGESFHKVIVTAIDNDDNYQVGMLTIKPEHWPRWEERFGRFVEIT